MNDLGDSFFYCKGKGAQRLLLLFCERVHIRSGISNISNLSVLPRHVHEAIHVATLGHVEGRPNGRGAVHDVVGTRGLSRMVGVTPILGVTFVHHGRECGLAISIDSDLAPATAPATIPPGRERDHLSLVGMVSTIAFRRSAAITPSLEAIDSEFGFGSTRQDSRRARHLLACAAIATRAGVLVCGGACVLSASTASSATLASSGAYVRVIVTLTVDANELSGTIVEIVATPPAAVLRHGTKIGR